MKFRVCHSHKTQTYPSPSETARFEWCGSIGTGKNEPLVKNGEEEQIFGLLVWQRPTQQELPDRRSQRRTCHHDDGRFHSCQPRRRPRWDGDISHWSSNGRSRLWNW